MAALRPYQIEVIDRVYVECADGRKRILIVAPTASGKTHIATEIVQRAVNRGENVLFFSHRREITAQTSRKLHELGIGHGIIQAGFKKRLCENVQVASIQTLMARDILPPATLVFIDEAHHAPAASYRRTIEAYPNATIIGLTATPCRQDGRGLGGIFEVIVESPQVEDLTRDGFLSPVRYFAPAKPDLKGVKVQRGDYAEAQLAERMDRPKLTADIVSTWLRHQPDGPRLRTIVFASGRAHAVSLRNEFRTTGVLAEHIDGTTPLDERAAILKRFADGDIEIITSVMVFSEGFDCPAAQCAILARPTKSLGLYRQMVGRVLRPFPGKDHALILDHGGLVFEHGLPDEQVVWTLDADKKAKNPTQTKRAEHQALELTTCPECAAVRKQSAPCPACGWRPQPKPKPVIVADGELGEVQRDRSTLAHPYTAAEREYWHGALLYIANERAQRRPFNVRGWVYHKYLEKFGHKPPFNKPPSIPPSAEIRAWVRSRDIAYAKSMPKQWSAAS